MGQCTDSRFEQMIHAYELELLTPEDREAFELHLYTCEHCFGIIHAYREQTAILRQAPEIRQTVAEVVAADDHDGNEVVSTTAQGSFRRLFHLRPVPAMLIAAVVLCLLILRPWRIEIRPGQEAQAAAERVMVMYFNNISDPADTTHLGEMAANLLIVDMAQSQYVRVVSGQRLYDLLKSLGYRDRKAPNRDIISQVARKAEARWLVVGSILRERPALALSAELVNVETGDVVAATRAEGSIGSDIFSLIDTLTAKLKTHLSLPPAAQQESSLRVADVTTHSPEAYQYYLEGIDNYDRYYLSEAAASFEKAVAYDSTFALAYYWLAWLKDSRLINRAAAYADKVSPKERHYIRSRQAALAGHMDSAMAELKTIITLDPLEKSAYFQLATYSYALGNNAAVVEYAGKAIAMDSLYAPAYNLLAYAYDDLGNFEQSILAMNTYIQKAPDEANPYDTRAELYARHGRLDDAVSSYRQAIAVKPDFYSAVMSLGHMYAYKQNYTAAESLYNVAANSPNLDNQIYGKYFLGLLAAQRGRFSAAIRILDSLLPPFQSDGRPALPVYIYRTRAFLRLAQQKPAMAVREFETGLAIIRGLRPNNTPGELYFYAQILAANGDFSRARAVVAELQHDSAGANINRYAYWYAAGTTAFAEKRFAAAVDCLENAMKAVPDFPAEYMLARAYLECGRLGEAVAVLERQIVIYDGGWRICLPEWRVSMHYYLGLAYEQSRWYDKARGQYRDFLELWKDAEPGIREIEDARNRLARLEAMS